MAELMVLRDTAVVDAGPIDSSTMIDLGFSGAGDPDWTDERPRVSARVVVAWVLALVCLLGLRTAVSAEPGPGDLLWTLSVGSQVSMMGGTDVVYLVDRVEPPLLVALDSRTGGRRWQLDVPRIPYRVSDLGRGVDAVLLREPTGPSAGQTDATILVDRATGVILARHAGRPVRRTGWLVLFEERERRCDDGSARCREVTALDLPTGTDRWRLRLPPGGRLAADWSTPTRFATMGPDASITVRDVATSAAVVSTPGVDADGSGAWRSAFVADLLVVGKTESVATDLYAYRASDLTRMWTLRLPRYSPPPDAEVGPLDLRTCGGFVCVSDGAGTAVLDAATGGVQFRTPLTVVTRLGGGVLVASSHVSLRGALGATAADLSALDSDTGDVLTSLPSARLSDAAAGGNSTPTGEPAVLLTFAERRTGFAVMASDGRLSQLFSVDYTDLRCAVGPAVVACLDDDGVLRAWRLSA